jgi:hypothetical protein
MAIQFSTATTAGKMIWTRSPSGLSERQVAEMIRREWHLYASSLSHRSSAHLERQDSISITMEET